MRIKLSWRGLCIALLAVMLLLVAAPPVFAYLYRAPFTISETTGTDRTGLAVNCSADVDWLIANGFITTATALDTRIETVGGVDQKHMVVEDRIMAFVPSLPGNSQLNWYLATGESSLSSFPVIVGEGGYVTVTDADALEPGSCFNITFQSWLDNDIDSGLYPLIASSNTSTVSVVDTNHTVNLPSDIEAGDLLLLVMGVRSVLASPSTITWPAGWTELDQDNSGLVGGTTYGVAYKIAVAGEGTTATATTSETCYSAHQTFRIVGYQGVPEISALTEATSAAPNSASLTPSWGSNETLWFSVFAGSMDSSQTLNSYPASYTGCGLTKTTAGWAHAGSAYRRYAAASEDPGAYALSGDIRWGAWTIAVNRGTGNTLLAKDDAFYIYTTETSIESLLFNTGKKITTSLTGSEEHKVAVYADGTSLTIEMDGVTENTTSLGGASVANSVNDWTISMPYFGYYKHYVGGTLVAWYQPVSYIVGTTLPDREGAAQNGTITWGSNPAGVTVALGGLTVPESTAVASDGEGMYRQTTRTAEVTDWFAEPDVGGKLVTHPLRPLVTLMSDTTTITEIQAWRFLGLALLLLVTVGTAIGLRGHLLIAGLACGGTIAVLVQQTVWPGWALVLIIPAIVAGVLAERTPSIG